jgi:hypothetical protein
MTKIGSLFLDKRRHFENKFIGGKWSRDRYVHYSEDMENTSLCIFRYLTVLYNK